MSQANKSTRAYGIRQLHVQVSQCIHAQIDERTVECGQVDPQMIASGKYNIITSQRRKKTTRLYLSNFHNMFSLSTNPHTHLVCGEDMTVSGPDRTTCHVGFGPLLTTFSLSLFFSLSFHTYQSYACDRASRLLPVVLHQDGAGCQCMRALTMACLRSAQIWLAGAMDLAGSGRSRGQN